MVIRLLQQITTRKQQVLPGILTRDMATLATMTALASITDKEVDAPDLLTA